MSDIAIRVENLAKLYHIGAAQKRHDTLRDQIADFGFQISNWGNRLFHPTSNVQSPISNSTIWALQDISFEVKRGEVVGIIGRNGAGKSTLLKILSRITKPTRGWAEIYGRVGSLLEVGTGFQGELTGRENIFLNGAILGMSKREIERKFDEIVAFSEVEKFIDTPVKHYSSGMYVRLAFAVAAHLEPKILIVDEVLAVGDAAFQKKCLGKMGDVAKEGRTVLFVSHQMQAITHFCNRCLLLNAGQLVSMGETVSIVNQYLSTGYTGEMSDLGSHTKRSGDGRLRFIESWIEDDTGNRIVIAQSGQTIKIVLRYKQMTPEPIKNLQVAIGLSTLGNVRVSELCNSFSGYFFDETIPYEGKIECILPKLPLNSGRYTYNIIAEKANGVIFDYIMDAGVLEVEAGDFFGTGRISSDNTRLILMEQEWSVSGEFESKGVIYDH